MPAGCTAHGEAQGQLALPQHRHPFLLEYHKHLYGTLTTPRAGGTHVPPVLWPIGLGLELPAYGMHKFRFTDLCEYANGISYTLLMTHALRLLKGFKFEGKRRPLLKMGRVPEDAFFGPLFI